MKLETLREAVQHSLTGQSKFPQIVGRLMEEGVESYHVDLVRGENRYYDRRGGSEVVKVPHEFPDVATEFRAADVQAAIRQSQQGLINYLTFIEQITRAGCGYYIAYLDGRQVIYFGRKGESHVEPFPNR